MEDNNKMLRDKFDYFEADYQRGDWEAMSAQIDAAGLVPTSHLQPNSLLNFLKSKTMLVSTIATMVVVNFYLIKANSDLNDRITTLETKAAEDHRQAQTRNKDLPSSSLTNNKTTASISSHVLLNKPISITLVRSQSPTASAVDSAHLNATQEPEKPEPIHESDSYYHIWEALPVLAPSRDVPFVKARYLRRDSVPASKKKFNDLDLSFSGLGIKAGLATCFYGNSTALPFSYYYYRFPMAAPAQKHQFHFEVFMNFKLSSGWFLRTGAGLNSSQRIWTYSYRDIQSETEHVLKQFVVCYETPVMISRPYKRFNFMTGVAIQCPIFTVKSSATYFSIGNTEVENSKTTTSDFRVQSPQLALAIGVEYNLYKNFYGGLQYTNRSVLKTGTSSNPEAIVNYNLMYKF